MGSLDEARNACVTTKSISSVCCNPGNIICNVLGNRLVDYAISSKFRGPTTQTEGVSDTSAGAARRFV
jgi:hypothetical protein